MDIRSHLARAAIDSAENLASTLADAFAADPIRVWTGAEAARFIRSVSTSIAEDMPGEYGLEPRREADRPE